MESINLEPIIQFYEEAYNSAEIQEQIKCLETLVYGAKHLLTTLGCNYDILCQEHSMKSLTFLELRSQI